MNLSEADQVMEALSANEANHKLIEGWTLLAVVATTHPSGELHPCYILGKSKTGARAQQDTAQQGQR